MELTEITFTALYRHTFTLDNVPGEWLAHLIVCTVQAALMAIQVTHCLLVAKQGLLQRDVEIHVEVVLDALEHIMWLLLQLHDNIALHHVGNLLSLTFKYDSFIACSTLHDVDHQRLLLHNNFLAPANATVFLISATSASALITRLLHLHLHKA